MFELLQFCSNHRRRYSIYMPSAPLRTETMPTEHEELSDSVPVHGQSVTQVIAVAVLTYQRTDLLDKLLEAYAAMERPSNARVIFIVVDNDAEGSAKATVDARRSAIGEVHYVVETRRGIPVARNRALDEALQLGGDAMCFIDDDEFPDPKWLVRLVECWRTTGAELIGGPVNVADPPTSATLWQRLVNSSLAARMVRKNRITAQRAAAGGRYTVVTNNWLCDLNWQRQAGVRFEEKMLVSGGSDTAFFHAALTAGAEPCWAPDAVVYETMLADRLSLAYQFFRGASQSNTHFRMKRHKVRAPFAVMTLCLAAVRFLLAILLFAIPVYGVASLVIATRSLGWSVGRVWALFGSQSRLYQ